MALTIDLNEQVVVITGAAGTLGRAAVLAFVDAGARVAAADHRSGRLAPLFPHLTDGPHLLADNINAADDADAERLVAQVWERFGRLDALLNIAGGFASGTPVHDTPAENWEEMLTLNLRTALAMSRAATPRMIEQGHGRILHIGSRAGVTGGANVAAYAVAKRALVTLAESQAAELKSKGITVNVVMPSTIDAPAARAANPKADPSKWVAPESLAGVLLFLASPLARDITGAAIPVYGRV